MVFFIFSPLQYFFPLWLLSVPPLFSFPLGISSHKISHQTQLTDLTLTVNTLDRLEDQSRGLECVWTPSVSLTVERNGAHDRPSKSFCLSANQEVSQRGGSQGVAHGEGSLNHSLMGRTEGYAEKNRHHTKHWQLLWAADGVGALASSQSPHTAAPFYQYATNRKSLVGSALFEKDRVFRNRSKRRSFVKGECATVLAFILIINTP